MAEPLPECKACGKRGMWNTVRIGNDSFWLCYDHVQEFRAMVLQWLSARRAS